MSDDELILERFQQQMEALEQNIAAHNRGAQQIEAEELASILDDIGERWRVAWEMMPRDQIFDSLYAFRADDSKRPFLYRKDPADVSTHAIINFDPPDYEEGEPYWWPHQGPKKIVEWLIDNPPFSELEPIAELYQEARGLTTPATAWVLLMAIIGQRPIEYSPEIALVVGDIHVGGIDMIDLMPVGENETLVLAKAMLSYSLSPEVAKSYIHLIDAYDSYLT
jgi:hypothetical protein